MGGNKKALTASLAVLPTRRCARVSLKIEMVESTKELNRSNTTIALPRHIRPLHDPKRMPKRHGGNPYRRRRPSDDEDIYRPSQTLLDSEQLNITQREKAWK